MDASRRVVILALVSACGDDVSAGGETVGSGSSEGGSSSASSSSGSSEGESTTVDPDSGTSTSSSGDPTTGGEVPTGAARVIVLERVDDEDLRRPTIRDYADGTLSEAVPLAHDVPDTLGIGATRITLAGTIASYCALPIAADGALCFARDASDTPLGDPQPFNVDVLAPPIVLGSLEWIAGASGYLLVVRSSLDSQDASIYLTPLQDGLLQPPRLLALWSEEQQIVPGNNPVAPDGRSLAYKTSDASDTTVWRLVSTVDPDATSVLLVPAPPVGAASPVLVWTADSRSLTYRQQLLDDPDADELYFVDVSSGTPGAPIRYDDPQYGRPGPHETAPDGHALVYTFIDDADGGGLMFVEVRDGVPQPPLLLDDQLAAASWSPDSRWLVYAVSDPTPDANDVQLIPAGGAEPGTPIDFGVPAPGLVVQWTRFTDDPRWLYASAELDGAPAELYRFDVSSDAPGPAQAVSGPLVEGARLDGSLDGSPDRRWLTYAVEQDTGTELWLVDVGGDEPGVPVRIAAPSEGEARLRRFSPDSTMLAYEVFTGYQQPEPHFLVDMTAPDVSIALSDDASGILFVTP